MLESALSQTCSQHHSWTLMRWHNTLFTTLQCWNLTQPYCQTLISTQFYDGFMFSAHLQKIQIWDQTENQMCRLQHPINLQGCWVGTEKCLSNHRDSSIPPIAIDPPTAKFAHVDRWEESSRPAPEQAEIRQVMASQANFKIKAHCKSRLAALAHVRD